MAAPVEQVGVIIACPGCGAEVLQKTMIPLGVLDGIISYSCVECARKQIVTGSIIKVTSTAAVEMAEIVGVAP